MTGSRLFDGIPSAELDAALKGLERRALRAGTVLAAEGDYLAEMYVLTSGSAEIAVAADGTPRVVASVGPGETIGEMSLLTHEPASASVRATDDVELLVLREDDLHALMERLPAIPRNVIRILSTRLARMTRRAARDRPVELFALASSGAPELLGYALSSSVAWHTRLPTLHVVVADEPPPALEALATASFEPPPRPSRTVGAELVIARPRDVLEADDLRHALERLGRAFRHVLVEAPSWPRPPGRVLDLAAPEHAVELEREEERALARGLLPATGTAGRALGGLARELARLKVGIALGSGSTRGYAHVGVLRRLETLGVPIDCLAGTSVGAIVAGLYAYFQDPQRVADFLDELGARMFRPTLSRKSLLSTRAMRSYIRQTIGDRLIEDVPIPVAFVATDVDTREEVVLRRGSGVTALFASSAVPGVFPAVRVGNRRLVDGGIVNPVPASVAVELGAGVVVASRLVSGGGVDLDAVSEDGEGPVPSAVSVIVRSIELVQTRMTASAGGTPMVMITPQFDDLPAAKLRRFREGRRYIAAGEAAVDAALPRLRAALPWLRD